MAGCTVIAPAKPLRAWLPIRPASPGSSVGQSVRSRASRCRACLVNFANRVNEAGRRSHNAQDMTVGGGEAVTDGLPDPDRVATQQDFGRELAAVRRNAGLTVRQVARAAGLPVRTAGDYFSGRHLPPDGRAGQLLEILRACGETDPAVLARWTSALQRAKRPAGRRAAGADAPYRGLARFEREDARWFFGREDVTDLLAALADEENPLPLVLVGRRGRASRRCCGRACFPG